MSDTEEWRPIFEFPNYDVSSLGRIFNRKTEQMMSISKNNFGHAKITLTDYDGSRYTRSVAQLVAEAFVEAPNLLCDSVILLDGDQTNLRASNLAWRTRAFAWKYTHQLKDQIPVYFTNLPVHDLTYDVEYDSIIQAGTTQGLLFVDIWRSTYSGTPVFPSGSVFEVIERV